MEIRFTEEMKGYRLADEIASVRDPHARADQPIRLPFRFVATIVVPDLTALLKDPGRPCKLTGTVFGREASEKDEWSASIQSAWFRLFAGEIRTGPVRMEYHIEYADPLDQIPVTLDGFKDISRRSPFFIWRDTTTLFCEWRNPALSRGILRIHILDFLKQLTTFRASGGAFPQRICALIKFFGLFARVIWNIYGIRG